MPKASGGFCNNRDDFFYLEGSLTFFSSEESNFSCTQLKLSCQLLTETFKAPGRQLLNKTASLQSNCP